MKAKEAGNRCPARLANMQGPGDVDTVAVAMMPGDTITNKWSFREERPKLDTRLE